MLNYKWNALYFLLSHHVPPSVRSIIVVCQRGATNCSDTCWGRLLFCGSWRIAFIKTQLQPPSGAVNRGVLRGGGGWRRGGVEPSLGTCLSRSSPALVWPRWRITEAGGPPPHTCVPLGETLMIIGRHHRACTQGEGPRQWCCEGETDALLWKGQVWCFLQKNKMKEIHIVHENCTVRRSSGVLWLQKHCCVLAHGERERAETDRLLLILVTERRKVELNGCTQNKSVTIWMISSYLTFLNVNICCFSFL